MILTFNGLQALVPSPGPSTWTEGHDGLNDAPALLGTQTTPLTTKSVTAQEKSDLCELYRSVCNQSQLLTAQCYQALLPYCGLNFREEMAAINNSDWCVWDTVKNPYNKFTVCTETVAECLLFPWPNRQVEKLFVKIHSHYFQDCPTETLRDPPPNVIFALVVTPILLIPAMVVLVVMKTKNGDRRS
ncbi:receptor activity-modifying protein 2 [Trichomycterus rosablanca]|uniref:receptor activity-modifying protein 2 n=1 Tax=Trichomycterus rosablanca TaxID=2290929 RepID=UPI002F360E52